MTDNKPAKGFVYFCQICGAEITVVRAGDGSLSPRCCNMQMEFKSRVLTVFFCHCCGSEAMVLIPGVGNTVPVCCNTPMNRVNIGSS